MKALCKLLSDILSRQNLIGYNLIREVNQKLGLWNFVDRPNYWNHSSINTAANSFQQTKVSFTTYAP